jgi:hypothetical protein
MCKKNKETLGEMRLFSEKMPEYGDWFVFVCPIQKDRWEVGWMDSYHVRVEGGESYRNPEKELTHYMLLPPVPDQIRHGRGKNG